MTGLVFAVVTPQTSEVLFTGSRSEACEYADRITGRAPGSSSYFLGRRRSVYVNGGRGMRSVRVVQRSLGDTEVAAA